MADSAADLAATVRDRNALLAASHIDWCIGFAGTGAGAKWREALLRKLREARAALEAGGMSAERESLFAAREVDELKDAGLLPWCGEWVDVEGIPRRCTARAEFILWGKLIDPDGLGPRCYDHAAKHLGHRGLVTPGKSGWAIADLRPLIRRTAAG